MDKGVIDRGEVIRFFADFWEIDLKKVKDEVAFEDPMIKDNNSARFYNFIAAVESNFDVKLKDINRIRSFGDVIRQLR